MACVVDIGASSGMWCGRPGRSGGWCGMWADRGPVTYYNIERTVVQFSHHGYVTHPAPCYPWLPPRSRLGSSGCAPLCPGPATPPTSRRLLRRRCRCSTAHRRCAPTPCATVPRSSMPRSACSPARVPSGLTMDAIACKAGVGKGTLFRRFGDRSALLPRAARRARASPAGGDPARAGAARPGRAARRAPRRVRLRGARPARGARRPHRPRRVRRARRAPALAGLRLAPPARRGAADRRPISPPTSTWWPTRCSGRCRPSSCCTSAASRSARSRSSSAAGAGSCRRSRGSAGPGRAGRGRAGGAGRSGWCGRPGCRGRAGAAGRPGRPGRPGRGGGAGRTRGWVGAAGRREGAGAGLARPGARGLRWCGRAGQGGPDTLP